MRTVEQFIARLPHALALGIELVAFDRSGHCVLRLPWREDLVGNPETGILHGGVITALLDTLGAACVLARECLPQATLDLRIDYLRPAQPRQVLIGEADCFRVTRHIAFVRGVCHQGDPSHAVANVTAAFILQESSP
jgi:uncharacterized protein (TIGR00369 family)